MTTKVNIRLSKGCSVTLKVAENRSNERKSSIDDSLVQFINVDTGCITDNRLQLRKKEKK